MADPYCIHPLPNSSYWLSATVLESALSWLRNQRWYYGIHDSVWSLVWAWRRIKKTFLTRWNEGNHSFSPLRRYRQKTSSVAVFEAEDSLLLKSLQLSMATELIPYFSQRVYHLKKKGGSKAAIRDTACALPHYNYVFKSDIKSFYDSMDHEVLLNACRSFRLSRSVLNLIKSSLFRVEDYNTVYTSFEKGIARGSPISPILGSIMLTVMDKAFEKIPDIYYARYMDDWVVLCKTRTTLRYIVKLAHRLMQQLKLSLHLDKTFIGKINKGFDFLGYRLSNESISINDTTLDHFRTQLQQRYAQEGSKERLVDYVRRFSLWCRSGVQQCPKWNDKEACQKIEHIFLNAKDSQGNSIGFNLG